MCIPLKNSSAAAVIFSIDSGRTDTENQDNNYSFRNFAILYRTHSLSKHLEEALARSGMPYQIIGGPSLWETPVLKRWRLLLRILENPNREIELPSIIAWFA